MKIAAVSLAVAAIVAGAAAQGLGDLPACAKSCATNAIPQSCGLDVKCICSAASFITDVSCCVAKACNQADIDTTIKFADNLCAGQGITLPTTATCPQTAAATGAQTSASSATTAAATTTAATAAGTSSSSTSSSSSSSSSSTMAASVVSSGTSASSASTTTGSSSSTTGTAAAAATKTGAAIPNAKTNGDVVAGVGAAAVLVAMCMA